MIRKISGEVIHGEKLGRKLGFPTANVSYSSSDIEDAVFHLNIIVDEKIYSGMGSHMVKKNVFEAHIFDFDLDIYGENIEIILLKKIRANRKFGSLDDLVKQIQADQELIKSQRLHVLTFGSFDHLHEGHGYYLQEARKYGNHLITIVASDKNITKIKNIDPKYRLKERVKALKDSGFSDEVIPGSDTDPMQWIELYKPHAICLGYDQRGPFVERLESEIDRLGLSTQIIRIPSHHPDRFKSSLLKNNLG
ncbi:adenylyltransferase/cytidyltransferase family protein [Candidatus Gracilibacteria bacterium]|nr:adenylyltransferase/cytidyltransferase family protein [Candidatus Gracilibacteria bacterium]